MRLDVSVHDPLRMTEIESFEEFKDVITNIEVGEFGIEGFEFSVLLISSIQWEIKKLTYVDILRDDRWCL
jgi:predicted PolB exonuclease-like 3'-5' exonuclease